MTKWKDRLEKSLRKFFQGRYGMDALNKCIFFGLLVTTILGQIFPRVWILSLLNFLLALAFFYRALSKDLNKRYLENQKFLESIKPVGKRTGQVKTRIKNRKTTSYFKCPQCKTEFKAPKGLGKIKVTCKNCGHKFIQKT